MNKIFSLIGLMSTGTLGTLLSASEDPCIRLCERTGICGATSTSKCVSHNDAEICTNLYWSSSQVDERTLVFNPTSMPLSPDRDRSVTCLEAAIEAQVYINPYLNVGIQIFANFDSVKTSGLLTGDSDLSRALAACIIESPTGPRFTALRTLQSLVTDLEDATSAAEIVHEIAFAAAGIDLFFDSFFNDSLRLRRVCNRCARSSSDSVFIKTFTVPVTRLHLHQESVNLQELLGAKFMTFKIDSSIVCGTCCRPTDHSVHCRLGGRPSEAIAIQLEYHGEPDVAVNVASEIDLSPFVASVASNPLRYKLVGMSLTNPEGFVLQDVGLKFVTASGFAQPYESFSFIANTFFYEKIN